jgi:hypothetical protein
MREVIIAKGHPNVTAIHKNTIEITREDFLTPKGDCIIGIESDKGLVDLGEGFKELLKLGKRIIITLECNGKKDSLNAYGDPRLTFKNPNSIVIRKSSFICGRTLCVRADKAAADLDRELIKELEEGGELVATLSSP